MTDIVAEDIPKIKTEPKINLQTDRIVEWENDLRRLIRRGEIYRQMQIESSAKEIKDTVREYEKEVGVSELVNALVYQEVVIQPKMASVASKLYESLAKEFPEVKAIVLMGSPVHGGAKIREATKAKDEPDLDWGIISSRQLWHEEICTIVKQAENLLEGIVMDENLSGSFHSCVGVNPLYYRTTNLKTERVLGFLQSVAEGELGISNLTLHLQPTYPSEVGIRNREILLSGFRNLAKKDKDTWRNLVEKVLLDWNHIHKLKEKHFNIAPKVRDDEIRGTVVENSTYVMGIAMRELLESTGNMEGSKPTT